MPIQPPDPATIQAMPAELQWLIYIGIGLLTALGGINHYAKAKKEKSSTPPAGNDLVITAAGIMDMSPVRDLSAQVMRASSAIEMIVEEARLHRELMEQHVSAVESIVVMLQKEANENEIRRRVADQVERERLRDQDPRPPRQR